MQEIFRNFIEFVVYSVGYNKETLEDRKIYRREGLVIPSVIRNPKAFGLPIRFRYYVRKGGI